MNRFVSVLLLVVTFAIVGCGGSKPPPATAPDQPIGGGLVDEKGKANVNAEKAGAMP